MELWLATDSLRPSNLKGRQQVVNRTLRIHDKCHVGKRWTVGTGGEAYDVMVRLLISRRWPVWAINTWVTIFTHASQVASTVKEGSSPSRRTGWGLMSVKATPSGHVESRQVGAGWSVLRSVMAAVGRRVEGWTSTWGSGWKWQTGNG